MIEIDGSFGEGGGQILRTSVALSAVTLKPVRIFNIRAKRKNPGLRRQHMVAVKALAEMTDAEVRGLELGSTEIVFIPKTLKAGTFRFDIGTAGSVSLVLQAVTPAALFAPGEVRVQLRGGTDVPMSPPVDYLRFVFYPLLERFGAKTELVLKRRGHYPKGGGEVEFASRPVDSLTQWGEVERGEVLKVRGLSHCVKLPKHVAERQAKAAEEVLKKSGLKNVDIDLEWYPPERDPHLGPGSGIVLWAITERSLLGADSLGARGKRAERVGEEAARKLLEDLSTGKALDRHMSDMIVPYVSLACGRTEVGGAALTMHAWTHVHVVKKFLPELEVEISGELNKPFVMRVKGVCWQR
ncbi:RNA 3'-terminal phosphate cyclase [Ignicoccus hospitalis]|uniref:RNA 3'-terminal phosphate cyclase n=1 Tax=Ignicoccus hospitalis (strain KIN4/I / DSM 18386 / JCM 14125) TaxID=453591 RepID=RTCA_IGNH4|nr:RNA 3'-terminal phosphate cyclase [Ignicoccus hospitalis]A8A9W2.1 RecName: Full=RNA 3'-terminal phosphate cyclase; Short=RNA cyclase; Short=RNA-3'-phosphate cyclase [Ignicoccus hospitalis KIN4/I]ABU81714.1 RNA-3'-phosphate cyclase [Ignicoccus hospitalis KIN4/I]HIH89977.1 RNA 3'-terminal phosphate cyclase [Desulfurococcaceae archaeon]